MLKRMTAGAVEIQTRSDGKPMITGYGAVFYDGTRQTEYELWGGTFERILPGAFDKALTDDVRGLVNHDPASLLGRTKAGTMRLSVDSRGLRYEIDPPDTTVGRDTLESIKRGDLSGSSFGFTITDESWVKENGVRVRQIRGVRLFDVGPVVFPAYEGTSAGLRAAGDLSEARESLARVEAAEIAKANAERERQIRLNEVFLP